METSRTLAEMQAELAAIDADYRNRPTIDEEDWDLFPSLQREFQTFAAFSQYCRERAARRRPLVRAVQTHPDYGKS